MYSNPFQLMVDEVKERAFIQHHQGVQAVLSTLFLLPALTFAMIPSEGCQNPIFLQKLSSERLRGLLTVRGLGLPVRGMAHYPHSVIRR